MSVLAVSLYFIVYYLKKVIMYLHTYILSGTKDRVTAENKYVAMSRFKALYPGKAITLSMIKKIIYKKKNK